MKANGPSGFVLLELLVAMAVLTAVATAALNILSNASYENYAEANLAEKIQKLRREPRAYEREPSLKLRSTLNLESGGHWRVYAYKNAAGKQTVFPVYFP